MYLATVRADTGNPSRASSAWTRRCPHRRFSTDMRRIDHDCGFAPGSAAEIPIDEAYAKLRSEVEAAKVLRARLSG
jgi:hypothetical protein